MKITNVHVKNRKAGVTLLELTVVILVLLTLISILFVGVNAWRKGSDRAANILNIRNVQQAMRGYQNTRGLPAFPVVGPPAIPLADFRSGANQELESFMKIPTPPATMGSTTYGFLGTVTQYATNPVTATTVAVPANLYVTSPTNAIPATRTSLAGDYNSPGAEVEGW